MTVPEIPYTAAWPQETDVTPPVTVRVSRSGYPALAFRGEMPHDRDHHDVLWRRQIIAPGRGRPVAGRVHSHRQRTAMTDLLCHVSADPALGGHALHDTPSSGEHSENRTLFLLTAEVREGHVTATPPLCHRCAPRVARARGSRKRSYTAVLVDEVRPWGVAGVLYDPTTLRPAADGGLTAVRYRSPRAPWVVAHQALISLHGITSVRLRLRSSAA
ncbi:hypothetical protein [Streptomyces catenulae]|uniref:Uncharacterized protein n=1 Tax=Streptomyces catenulae TaxID=66875 RepID=A0ABV2Z2H0_9ACTN|nr:hypothetical protein [Streptomyces catenulae]